MSRRFQAYTKSGTFYLGGPGGVNVSGDSGSQFFHNPTLRSIPHEVLGTWTHIDWDYIASLPTVEAPIVGEHLLTSDLDKWRLSTPITIVEVL